MHCDRGKKTAGALVNRSQCHRKQKNSDRCRPLRKMHGRKENRGEQDRQIRRTRQRLLCWLVATVQELASRVDRGALGRRIFRVPEKRLVLRFQGGRPSIFLDSLGW